MMAGTNDVLDPIVVALVKNLPGNDVFDYGCGHTDLTWKIHELGREVVGYDICDDMVEHQKKKAAKPGISFIGKNEIGSHVQSHIGKYDCVISSLVLCVIEDSKELEHVMGEMKSLLKPGGSIIVSICNPLSIFTKESGIQTRVIPSNKTYLDEFEYEKIVKITGGHRKDYHRPLGTYEKVFEKLGLRIVDFAQSPSMDGGSPDFLVMRLVKVVNR